MTKKNNHCPVCNILIWSDSTFCRKHFVRKNLFQKGKKHWNWKSGKIKNVHGYISVKSESHPYCNNRGYVLEHRLVMEQYIGRYLRETEDVHHKDHNRSNNSIENLEIIDHREHGRMHAIEQHSI